MNLALNKSPNTAAIEHFVDAEEAAAFLKLHPRTLQQMARDGDLPAYPLGNGKRKTWRFRLSQLAEWMQEKVNSKSRPCRPRGGIQ